MNKAFVFGFVDEMEKGAKAGGLSRTYAGAKIPRGRLKRALMRVISPTVSGRAVSAAQLKMLRKLDKTLGVGGKGKGTQLAHLGKGKRLSRIGKAMMEGPESKRMANIQFAINRLAGAGALAGGGAIAHRLLKKKKKTDE